MVENPVAGGLLLQSDPDIKSAIDRGTVLMKGILNNSVLNSTLGEYIETRSRSVEAVKSSEFKAALLTLLFRSQGKLSTPEEPDDPSW